MNICSIVFANANLSHVVARASPMIQEFPKCDSSRNMMSLPGSRSKKFNFPSADVYFHTFTAHRDFRGSMDFVDIATIKRRWRNKEVQSSSRSYATKETLLDTIVMGSITYPDDVCSMYKYMYIIYYRNTYMCMCVIYIILYYTILYIIYICIYIYIYIYIYI